MAGDGIAGVLGLFTDPDFHQDDSGGVGRGLVSSF